MRYSWALIQETAIPATIDLNQSDSISGEIDDRNTVFSAANLFGENRKSIVDDVRRACLETGFFVIEPGSQLRLAIDGTLGQMQRFFSLDDQDPRKLATRQGDSRRGWRPRFSEPAYQPGTVSSLEAFDVGIDEVRNVHDCWPSIDGFREDVAGCWNELLVLGDAVLATLAGAAGIDEGFLVSNCDSRALNSMRLLHYAGDCPEPDETRVGISAHTDFECITLLYQSAPGLELRTVDGEWLDASAAAGHIVVMLDDMLERWTNGVFKATGHRVRETDEQRFSIVMFMAANDDVTIAPLENFVSGPTPAAYEPITQAAHLDAEIRRARENAKKIPAMKPA